MTRTKLYGAAAMADEQPAEDNVVPGEPVACGPCRGRGKVISGAGGDPKEVTCPWCEGGGVTIPGHDAQQAWRERQEPAAQA